MSETIEAPEEPPKPKQPSSYPKKPRRIGYRQKRALLEIIHRKKLNWSVDYRGVATRWGISIHSLKQHFVLWKKSMIDMGDADTPEQVQIDAQTQFAEQMCLLVQAKQMALNCFRAVMMLSQEDASKGDPMAPMKRGLPQSLAMIDRIQTMMEKTEKGYLAVLEDARMARAGLEKPVNGSVLSPDVKSSLVSSNDTQLAIAALDAPSVEEERNGQ